MDEASNYIYTRTKRREHRRTDGGSDEVGLFKMIAEYTISHYNHSAKRDQSWDLESRGKEKKRRTVKECGSCRFRVLDDDGRKLSGTGYRDEVQ